MISPSQSLVLLCVAGGSMITGWEANDRWAGEQRADLVEKHIQGIESDAADWATMHAKHEAEVDRVRRSMCGSFYLRTNLQFYERTDSKFPRLCGENP